MSEKRNRYLLHLDIKKIVKELKLKKEKSVSFFTVAKLCKEVKYCKLGLKYEMCIKEGIYNLAKVKKVPITEKEYQKAKKQRIGNKIKKDFYAIKSSEGNVALHMYKGKLKSLSTLTNSGNLPKQIEQFRPYIIDDITSDERYTEHNLVFYGDPKKSSYNIYSIFKDIELERVNDVSKFLFKEMATIDAVKVVLFKLFMDIKKSHTIVIQSEGSKGTKEFEDSLKSTRVILKSFENIFEEDLVKKVLKHLKIINISMKREKNLRYIKKQLSKISSFIDKDELEELQRNINYKHMIEKKKIKNFFTTREFTIIFRQYELLLKESNKNCSTRYAKKPIGQTIEKIVLNCDKQALALFDKYSECEDNLGYKEIVKSLKAIDVILEEFDNVITFEYKPKLSKSVDAILSKLHTNKDIKRKKLVADTYLNNIQIKPKEYKRIKKRLKKDSKVRINKNREIFRKEILNLQNR